MLAFTDAEMKLGIELVANNIHLEDKIKEADYIFTGEVGWTIKLSLARLHSVFLNWRKI
ncbi:hypothetical protein ICE98_00835 [Lactococcus lactis]|nr:hypothetical protein [Lactococcus lactis]